ncbi:MAG: hypothetical protein IKZ82_00390, partial [Clostridia bacterium]|nr:hypothetical protein [Clostridia bacterium]
MELLRENSCIEFISEDQIEGKASSIAAVSQKACGYDEETIKSIVSAAPARMMKELKMLLDPSSGICVEELRFRVGRPLQLISSAGEILLP